MLKPLWNRRRHVVYVTRNTEYHCRGRECVGVRDRETGRWQRWHPALRARLLGSVAERHTIRRQTRLGARLVFDGRQLILTSKLEWSGRPEKEVIWSYSSLCRAGEILAA
jgi:hypothetical protein